MAIVEFNPNNGQKLKPGETVTYQGKTYTQGSTNTAGTPTNTTASSPTPVKNTTASTPTATSQFNLNAGNLSVGSKGDNVKQLQQILGVTPDGIFGPKTQQAVINYQSQNGLKPDGIVGPLTTQALNKQSSNSTAQPNSAVPNSQLGLLGAIADVATNTYSTKNSGLTLDEALNAAQNDPNIVAKYSDMLKLDQQGFQQALQELQRSTSSNDQQQKIQFENDRKNLAEKYAAAGQAYSGLRGKAQDQLGTAESGIVASSRSALQRNLNDLTTAFESKYGSGSSSAATALFNDPFSASTVSLSGLKTPTNNIGTTISGQMAGGITGSEPIQKKNDILNKGTDLYNVGQLPVMG